MLISHSRGTYLIGIAQIILLLYFYFQYYPGTVPIIISAPHGGTEEPSEISNRIAGCPTSDGECVYEKDEVRFLIVFLLECKRYQGLEN